MKENSSKVSSHFRKVNECYKVNGVEEKTISPTSAPELPPKRFVSISRENQHSGHVTAPLILKRLVLICVLEPDDFCDFSSKQRKQQQGTSLSCRPSRHSTSFIWTKKCNCSQEVKEGRVKLTCMLSHHHILNLGLSPHLQFKKKKAKINKRLLSCQTLIYSPIGSRGDLWLAWVEIKVTPKLNKDQMPNTIVSPASSPGIFLKVLCTL